MIVISTNNTCVERECQDGVKRKYFLENILNSLENINNTDDVLVIDTGTTDIESLDYIDSLRKSEKFKFKIIIDKTPYSGYDSGAIVWAVKNHVSDYYFFFHDSLEIKTNFFEDVKNKLNNSNVGCWIEGQNCGYDNTIQSDWVFNSINTTEYNCLLFGSIFFIKRETILRIVDQIKLLPTCKNEANGMERGWPSLFSKNNISIFAIDGTYEHQCLLNNGYTNIRKHLAGRQ